jgi:iron complex outermembrane recepter protein
MRVKMTTRRHGNAALRLLLLPLLLAGTASAEETESTAELEQVVVTAQRKKESLQQTPVSVIALNSDKLQQRGILGMADLQGNVPNLTIEPFPTNQATLRVFIRGIGIFGIGIFDAQITQDPGVGVYQDGVYIARSTGLALDLADLERIEVLRGPQGTLYGRNTIGGAVNLVTKRPTTSAFSMQHQLSYGSRDTLNLKSSVNVPLTSDLAV